MHIPVLALLRHGLPGHPRRRPPGGAPSPCAAWRWRPWCWCSASPPRRLSAISFQMSFAAVLALIAGYEALRPALARLYRKRALYYLATLSLTSLLAGARIGPVRRISFRPGGSFILCWRTWPPCRSPAMAAMPAGLLALALMPLGLERLALVPMGWALDAVLWIARTVSALPAATLGVPHMPGAGLLLIALGLAWLGLWRSRPAPGGRPGDRRRVAVGAGQPAGRSAGFARRPASSRCAARPTSKAARARPASCRIPGPNTGPEPLAAPFPESGEPGPVRCDADGCRIIQSGTAVLLARSLHPMDCTGAALLISAEPARAVCPALPHIDRFTVWRDGAQAVMVAHMARPTCCQTAPNRGERPSGAPAPRRPGPAHHPAHGAGRMTRYGRRMTRNDK